MKLASQVLVNTQPMMPSSSGASRNSAGAGNGNVSDQFPVGLRVLVVDDDPTCLMILENMLRKCKYEVTKCNRAEVALSLLRENKNGFDVVISDVHMPDMDGFILLVHIGLEMDLPVIMMSADASKSVVMKGVTHGACDYLIKPVRIEALRNIWQHVVRKRKHEWKDLDQSTSLEDQKQPKDPDYSSSANEGHDCKNTKRRKDVEDEERDDSYCLKKPRVVWCEELHQQFCAAVTQLGIDKAVPKKILDLMNVPGLKRENVASHLQKYRSYLKKLAQKSGGINTSFMGNPDAGCGSLSLLTEPVFQAPVASGQCSQLPGQSQVALAKSGNSKSPISIFSVENPKPRCGQGQNPQGHSSNIRKQMNFLQGVPTTMEPKQLVGLPCSFTCMNSQLLIPATDQSKIQSQTHNHASRQPVLSNGMADNMRDTATAVYNPLTGQSQSQSQCLVDFQANHKTELTGNSFPLKGSFGIPSIILTPALQQKGSEPSYGLPNNVNQNNILGGLNVSQHNCTSGLKIGGSKVIFSTEEGSGTHGVDNQSQAKAENVNYGRSSQPISLEESQDDLLTAFLTQLQEGVGQPENEFYSDWYSLDNLTV